MESMEYLDESHRLALDMVSGGGLLGDLIRKKDWSKTVLGPISSWPQSLLTTVSLVLMSKFPMVLFWGPEFSVLYNDAYLPVVGLKHPNLLGMAGEEGWREVWQVIGPMLEKVRLTGDATWSVDQLLLLTRNNYPEECYFTFSYSAIRGETGGIAGVITPVTETTTRVLSERRLRVLRELANKTSRPMSDIEACKESVKTIGNHPDLPFTLIYLAGIDNKSWNLVAHGGLRPEQAAAFPSNVLASTSTPSRGRKMPWDEAKNSLLTRVFSESTTQRILVEVKNPSNHFGPLPGGQWTESPTSAYAVPIPSDQNTISGILFVGINPCRACDDDYRGFLEILAGQIGRSISSARVYEAERKRAEALAEIDNAKTLFFSNVSHEFRTPLTLIMGPLEELLNDPQSTMSEGEKDKLVMIHRNSIRLHKLVNSLLDFSRIEAGKTKGAFQLVDLAHKTIDIASMFRSAFQKANIRFDVQCTPLACETYVDPTMWEKIVLNLLSNAFKYTLSGGVTVTLREENGQAVLTVSDTGVGIPESEVPRLFERFHRVPGSNARSHEGSGIGLALVGELVKLHGGSVKVTSKENIGSTFEVSIPLGRSHLPPDQIASNSSFNSSSTGSREGAAYIEEILKWLPSDVKDLLSNKQYESTQMGGAKQRILVVDDNSDMREYMKYLLEEFWDVTLVCNGEEALRDAKIKKPDLIISDVMMPVIDGFKLIELLKEDPALHSIPVILLSARAGEEAKVEGLRAGADDYLVKPFSSKELLARVHTHIENGRMREELEQKVRQRTEQLERINANLQFEIQQRQEIAKALASSEEHYRNLASVSPVGIFHTDVDGTPIYVNPSWMSLTGLKLSQLQEKKWYEQIAHRDDLQTIRELFDRAQRSTMPASAEFRLVLSGSKVVWVLGQLTSERTKSGDVIGYIGTITDMTELKHVEQDRIEAARELAQHKARTEQAEFYRRQQEQFIDMICHEIRNPLTGVDGNAELMKDTLQVMNCLIEGDMPGMPSGPKHSFEEMIQAMHSEVLKLMESLDSISECIEHQKLIVNDVLDLSKLEANKLELNMQPFSAVDVLISVKKMFETQAAKKQLTLTVSNDSTEDVIVKGDHGRVAQILINLVSNAIKFTHAGGVDLRLQVDERTKTHSKLRFTVRDTGVGLSDEEKSKLFQRFAQANRSTFAEYGGSGLGLFISKNLARLMDGDIFVESEKWNGAKFIVVIRFENPSEAEVRKIVLGRISISKQATPVKQLSSNTGTKVLIVEDNKINQQLLSKYFDQTNLEYQIANNGFEAVESYEKSLSDPAKHIDLILMDIEMPVMNGHEAASAIRKLEAPVSCHVPIIALSGNARCSHIQKALTAGMDDYITKPFKKQEIFEKIRDHLQTEVSYCEPPRASSSSTSTGASSSSKHADVSDNDAPSSKRTKLV